MNKTTPSATTSVATIFLVCFMVLVAFGAIGSFAGKPYKTDTAVVTAAIFGICALLSLGAGFGLAFLMAIVRAIGYFSYFFGASALLNAIVFMAWGNQPYHPVYTAWAIVLAGVFFFTRERRKEAEEEARAEGSRIVEPEHSEAEVRQGGY